MTTTSKARALRLVAVLAACAAGDAQAQSLSYIYSVRRPFLSLTTGAQLGNNNKIVADQHSPINVFAVTQIGAHDSAIAHQTGRNNTANVTQVSPGVSIIVPFAP